MSIHLLVDGFNMFQHPWKILVIGDHQPRYGWKLCWKYVFFLWNHESVWVVCLCMRLLSHVLSHVLSQACHASWKLQGRTIGWVANHGECHRRPRAYPDTTSSCNGLVKLWNVQCTKGTNHWTAGRSEWRSKAGTTHPGVGTHLALALLRLSVSIRLEQFQIWQQTEEKLAEPQLQASALPSTGFGFFALPWDSMPDEHTCPWDLCLLLLSPGICGNPNCAGAGSSTRESCGATRPVASAMIVPSQTSDLATGRSSGLETCVYSPTEIQQLQKPCISKYRNETKQDKASKLQRYAHTTNALPSEYQSASGQVWAKWIRKYTLSVVFSDFGHDLKQAVEGRKKSSMFSHSSCVFSLHLEPGVQLSFCRTCERALPCWSHWGSSWIERLSTKTNGLGLKNETFAAHSQGTLKIPWCPCPFIGWVRLC